MPSELKLNVNGPCGQRCEFCSIATDRIRPDSLEPLQERVRGAAKEGVHALRITGIDPLAFAGILALLETARDVGFTHLELHGPSVRLSDETFVRALLTAAPPYRRYHVPLYGADAASHDAVVGVTGAFDRVLAALDVLARLEAPRAVTVHTVCTLRVLPSLPAIVALTRARNIGFAADLPFPERETPDDPYRRVTPTQHEVADAMIATGLDVEQLMRVSGLWPCALHTRLTHASEAKAARMRMLVPSAHPASIGARTPLVRCPQAGTCRFVPACSGEILRAYVTLHGDGELAPW